MIFTRAILFFTSIFLLGNTPAFAQEPADTTKPKVPLKTVSFSPENFNFGNLAPQDSVLYALDSFQIVHPFLISTGNLGAPGHYLIPHYFPADAFSVRPDAFAYFGFNRCNRRFYQTNQPYTLLQYFVGQRREQYVDVLHARNFGDNLNFSFHFIRARSEGFYKRQNTSNTSLQTNLWYKSPGKRYAFMADIFWTGENVAENGGLADDSTFEFAEQVDRQVNEVNLDAAGTVQRKRDVWMKHTFALGKVTDTLVLDSTRSYRVITPAWGISITSELYDEKYNYHDDLPTAGFYDVIYRDSLVTDDSTYCWRVNNSIHLEKFNQYGAKTLRGYVGARHEAGEYFNDTIYKHFQNLFAEFALYSFAEEDGGRYQLGLNGWMVVNGNNRSDFFLKASLDFAPKANLRFIYTADVFRVSPAMIFTNYSGNHFRWENSFRSSTTFESYVAADFTGQEKVQHLRVFVNYVTTFHPLYFDSTFLPAQLDTNIEYTTAGLNMTLKFGWFNTATNFTYTHNTNDSIVRLPAFIIQESMYADFHLFKSAMQMQAGIDVTWFSEFTAEAYMPAVAQFYLQNSRTVGNYTWISPWVSFRIKPVRVFVKVDHVNAGLMGRKYFLLDHYPGNDMALKIGISWLFSD